MKKISLNVSSLFCFFLLYFSLFSFSSFYSSADFFEKTGIDFQINYQLQSVPLTTEKVLELDPDQRNPHLQLWLLKRTTDLYGVRYVKLAQQKYGIQIQGAKTNAEGYVRKNGPWFQALSDFQCKGEPNSWFQTEEGAKKAVGFAAEAWSALVDEEKVNLDLAIHHIVEGTEAAAKAKATLIFNQWLEGIDAIWRRTVHSEVRKKEWKDYREEAQALGFCKGKANELKVFPTWRSMMEPLPNPTSSYKAPLARAPARRWNGLFSVRVDMKFGDKMLNGQFLIDSAAEKSIISPIWLEAQGANVIDNLVARKGPEPVTWAGEWESETKLARSVIPNSATLSGLDLGIKEFLLVETEFFGPPENAALCCDGILGVDFLRKFPVEFHTEAPLEVRVWPAKDFQRSADSTWFEVSESFKGQIISSCVSLPAGKKTKKSLDLKGAIWETGSEEPLYIHTPWKKAAFSIKPNSWKIACTPVVLASNARALFPTPWDTSEGETTFTQKFPAVSLGMALLSRGDFTFDLPHGRLWLSNLGLKKNLPAQNDSGLVLKYGMVNGERILGVVSIKRNSRTKNLIKAGLKKGTLIRQIDSREASEIDFWEVERRLAGDYGNEVTLIWGAKGNLKEASFDIR